MKFEFEYVVGYSGLCGHWKGGGFKNCTGNEAYENGPIMKVYLADKNDPTKKVLVYQTETLQNYPYDNCCRDNNGCWGDVNTKNDGCYSPAVKVMTEKQADNSWLV